MQPRVASTELGGSPFSVLGATARDSRKRIIELAEERSLLMDPDLCARACSEITNLRTRLRAEIAWLPGVSPRKAIQLLDALLHDPSTSRQESGLPVLAQLNLMASGFESVQEDHPSDDLVAFIHQFAQLAEQLRPEEVLRDINEDRAVSGFPEIRSLEQVEDELSGRRQYFRNAIKGALDRLPSAKLVDVLTLTVKRAILEGEDDAPSLIYDLIDSYEVEAQAPLLAGAERLLLLIRYAAEVAPSGEAAVAPFVDKIEIAARGWSKIALPIQVSAKARGIQHRPSSNTGWAIRDLSLDLFNSHNILSQSQRLTALLQDLYSEVPEISVRVIQDAEALDDIASNRRKLAAKFKDFQLSGTSFTWKNQTYDIQKITHIDFYRAVTTHKTNFIATGKTENALLTLSLNDGRILQIGIDENGILFNKNQGRQIQTLADFYGYLLRVTFDRRLKFYENQIEVNGYWKFDECDFFPGEKVVCRGREFYVARDSFLRSYGKIELRKKDDGILDKIKREFSFRTPPQFSTLTDTDVIFHMLEKHMGLRWNDR